jgi:uncharacterized protein with NRDE domain
MLRRPGHAWPLLLAANRDEMADRAWAPPDRHWPDRPDVVAGQDLVAGGSWLGVNDHGVVAGILNRPGSLGPTPGKRSRGELVLEALDHADALAAAAALIQLDTDAYRPFNMIVADDRDAYWLRHDNTGRVEELELPEGFSMVTSNDLNDLSSPRIRRYLPLFEAARIPDPDAGDWRDWVALLSSRSADAAAGPRGALNVVTEGPYGTVSSSLIALPEFAPADIGAPPRKPIWLFAAGRPGEAPFRPVPF